MSAHLRLEQCCVRDGCKAPIRELGGLCSAHWRGLQPEQRSMLAWEHEALRTVAATEPIDSLELWWQLPAFIPQGRRAA